MLHATTVPVSRAGVLTHALKKPESMIYAFGPFQLDDGTRRLTRDGDPVALSDRHVQILLALVSQAGNVVPKDVLIDVAWPDVAVGDNSVEQAISSLRRLLGPSPASPPYIETLARRGYRFSTPVTRSASRESDDALESLLAPQRAFVEGRTLLETLDRGNVARAREVLEGVVRDAPDFAPGHVALANALTLGSEAAWHEEVPHVETLQTGAHHAREACRLDPTYAEAWATLAFVLSRAGVSAEATAAGLRAIQLEPDAWQHHVRLAYATWGEQRLRAARRALALLPDLGLARWLAATVLVARQSLDEAERELVAGADAQDRQPDSGRYGAVGLHLQLGLVRLARGDEAGAVAELERELSFARTGHIYAREACVNTWCALGAIRFARGERAEAVVAFTQGLDLLPAHPLALAALAAVGDGEARAAAAARLEQRRGALAALGRSFQDTMTQAVTAALAGRHAEAAALVQAGLRAASPGDSAGWLLPVEPFLRVGLHPDIWDAALATLRSRAA